MNTSISTVDEYIEQFPPLVQVKLIELRNLIQQNAPKAKESISYGMPAYKLNNRPLVYFAGYKNHIGFYATPNGHEAFKKELSVYKQGKGSVQFPLGDLLPITLIKKIVRYRVSQVQAHDI